jgi:protease I
MFSPKSGRVR